MLRARSIADTSWASPPAEGVAACGELDPASPRRQRRRPPMLDRARRIPDWRGKAEVSGRRKLPPKAKALVGREASAKAPRHSAPRD